MSASAGQDRQELIEHFVSVTGATEEIALQFLEGHDWQLETSVQSYMAIVDDGDSHDPIPTNARAEPENGSHHWSEQRVTEDEEEMAAIEAAMAASAAGKRTDREESPAAESEKPRRERPARAGREEQAAMTSALQGGIEGVLFERYRNFAAEGYGVPQSAAPTQDDSLEAMFPPPKDLIFHGNFDALRKKAEEEQKYCLVNIQRRDEFSSHQLNRDTWKDERVKELVRSQFLFWQQQFESMAGRHYLSIYPTLDLPTVDIINPLTGALLDRFSRYSSPDDMVERLTRFLDSHEWGTMGKAMSTMNQLPFDMTAYHAIDGPSSADKRTRMSLESEDPDLDAAIASSLQDCTPPDGCLDEDTSGRAARRERPDSTTALSAYTDTLRVTQEMEFQRCLEEDQEKERRKEEEEEQRALERALALSQEEERLRILRNKEAGLGSEPGPDEPNTTMLALRFPDGTRKNRRFRTCDTIQLVMDFMHVNGADPEKHTLVTTFPRRVLEDPAQTLAQLGLAQQTMLNVEAK